MSMRLKLICCDVLFRMACGAAARSPNVIDIAFTRLRSHNEPDALRKEIQGLIDAAADEDFYDAVLLGYGLCGNSTAGLVAKRHSLVIPRSHDCCTLFLGSRDNFSEHFGGRLSAQWSSHGYLERSKDYKGGTDLNKSLGLEAGYAELVDKYGEENAEYIWETLHPAHSVGKDERIYIDVAPFDGPENGDRYFKKYEEAVIAESAGVSTGPVGGASGTTDGALASSTGPAGGSPGAAGGSPGAAGGSPGAAGGSPGAASGSPGAASGSPGAAGGSPPKIQRLQGSSRLVDKLLDGDWDEDFLIVPPGATITPVYDMEQVVMFK